MSKSIAERIEALEGPCREMDAEIAVSLGWCLRVPNGLKYEYWFDAEGERNEPPHYTASLDAAMSLVSDATDVTIGRVWCSHRFAHITDGETTWSGKATIEALALCAAALRAQEATNG